MGLREKGEGYTDGYRYGEVVVDGRDELGYACDYGGDGGCDGRYREEEIQCEESADYAAE